MIPFIVAAVIIGLIIGGIAGFVIGAATAENFGQPGPGNAMNNPENTLP